MGARREGELTAGRVWSVAGCSESPRLPAVEVPVGGGLSGALFKRLAEALRARPALAAQTCRAGLGWCFLECGSGRRSRAEWLRSPRPLVLGALQPLPQPPLSASASLSLSLARSHFSPAAAAAAPAPRPATPAGRLPLYSFPSPEPLGRTPIPRASSPAPSGSDAGLPGGRSRACRGSPAGSLALAGAATERRVLGGGCSPAAASSSLRRPGLRAAPLPARSAASAPPAAARALGTARTSLRLPPPRVPGAGGRATDPSARRRPRPRSVSYGPRGRDRGDHALRLLGRGLRRGPRGSGRWPLTSSRAQDSLRKIRADWSS